MKRVAILQSNYIPWKGYFDLMAAVDEFIIYDDMQFTKNDWRNRNKIKTPQGLAWLSIPVGQDINRRIRDVEIPDRMWRRKHWKSLEACYGRTACFREIADWLEPLYTEDRTNLSEVNRGFIEAICRYLGIRTIIKDCQDYPRTEGRTERLVELCKSAGASNYISGPAAKGYLEVSQFQESEIEVNWFDYDGYPEYPQPWGPFAHSVTILDLLFCCGKNSPAYMRYVDRPYPAKGGLDA